VLLLRFSACPSSDTVLVAGFWFCPPAGMNEHRLDSRAYLPLLLCLRGSALRFPFLAVNRMNFPFPGPYASSLSYLFLSPDMEERG